MIRRRIRRRIRQEGVYIEDGVLTSQCYGDQHKEQELHGRDFSSLRARGTLVASTIRPPTPDAARERDRRPDLTPACTLCMRYGLGLCKLSFQHYLRGQTCAAQTLAGASQESFNMPFLSSHLACALRPHIASASYSIKQLRSTEGECYAFDDLTCQRIIPDALVHSFGWYTRLPR